MGYEQVGTVLKEVCQFHRHESELFDRLAERIAQPRAKMLLQSMSDHERQLASSLEDYVAAVPHSVLKTWLGRRLDLPLALQIAEPTMDDSISVDELLQLGLDLDEQLLSVLQDCADCCGPDSVRDVFAAFVEQQQQEERQLARQVMRSLDL